MAPVRERAMTIRGHMAMLRVLSLLAGGAALPSVAWARDLRIEGFDAQIVVEPDGTIDVKESIQGYFGGAWQGLLSNHPD